ncbi:MAG TPA: DUF1127 domain-containing protein [Acetobacteraceae bacterium]|jgi:uncharacterized protein YjiS (DUF1127 family)|nr:DUF1127 domain-containing protein [Acetobacteraceae bacterium]
MSNRLLFEQLARLRLTHPFASPSASVWMRICAAWRRYRSRQRLAQLDSHALKDIGVSFSEAEAEANKWFWQG